MLNMKKLLTKVLFDSKWKEDFDSKYAHLNDAKYRIKSGMCTINFQTAGGGAPAIPSGTWTILFTLPVGARPSTTIYAGCGVRSSYNAEIQIGTDGRVGINPSGATSVWAATITFPLG